MTRLVAVLGIGALLTGCSIKIPYMNISQWPTGQYVAYYGEPVPHRIGVLPLEDHRPAHEQTGQKPRGLFLLLWNRRVGDYYTGDRMFGGRVAAQLTDQLIGHMETSHAFADVMLVSGLPAGFNPDNADSVSQVGRDLVVDYLLRGEIAHFFGSQSQHTSTYLLPLYFVNTVGWQDSKSLPWGRSAIIFTVYDGQTGDIAWRRVIETDRTLPRDSDSMSQAALEAFSATAAELTRSLRELPPHPALASQ